MKSGDDRLVAALERIGRVLGALYSLQLGELDQPRVAERLSRCGFSNSEIADLLGTTANAINVSLHRARKAKPGKRPRTRKGR